MTLRLVDSGWDREIRDALKADHATVRIVCPFIKHRAARRLLAGGPPEDLRLITRFNVAAFARGVSDTSALRVLMDAGARVRGIRGVHAKLYVFGAKRAIVTSANLTEAGLSSNHEFGAVIDELVHLKACHRYFKRQWSAAGPDLIYEKLDAWDADIQAVRDRGAPPYEIDLLPDEGAIVPGVTPDPFVLPVPVAEAAQVFVKFFGQARNRAPRSLAVIEEVERSGSHWACTYPASKRPTGVRDGDVLYLAGMVKGPDDIMIFGWAIGQQYVADRDVATGADRQERPWKSQWPHYIRVYGAQFISAPVGDGVSLAELMDTLGAEAFASTSDHQTAGEGNTNPRRAYNHQPAVRLSPAGTEWVARCLQQAFDQHGRIPKRRLVELDWPDNIPGVRVGVA